jgi:hypothetical protein
LIPKEDLLYVHDVEAANVTPMGRFVLLRVERLPRQGASIWTPRSTEQSSDGLGQVVHGRVVRVGTGAWEPAWLVDQAPNGKTVRLRDGQQKGAPTDKAFFKGAEGEWQEVRVSKPGKLVHQPVTQVKPGDRVLFAIGWGPKLELKDGVYFCVHEDGLLMHLVDEHVHDYRLEWDDAGAVWARCDGATGDCFAREIRGDVFRDVFSGRPRLAPEPAESFDPQVVTVQGTYEPSANDLLRRTADDDE